MLSEVLPDCRPLDAQSEEAILRMPREDEFCKFMARAGEIKFEVVMGGDVVHNGVRCL